MQSLQSNTQEIYYATYQGKEDVIVNGKKTGEKRVVYSDPVPYRIYVSPARGTSENDNFGINIEYTNVMSTHDKSCPIDESTALWIYGRKPPEPHNYEVKRVARGLNLTTFAIAEVSLS